MRAEDRRLGLLVVVFGLFAVSVSSWLTQVLNPRHYDFAAYWQASRMTLDGENVYDSQAWLAAREHYQTALHSEAVFQYPLPLALLLAPLAFLPVEKAYFVWMLFNLIGLLLTLVLLLSYEPSQKFGAKANLISENLRDLPRPAWLEVTLAAGSFLFRPVYSALIGGQILFFWLFALTLACWLLQRGRNWGGGALLAALLLKPSIGLPFLFVFGVWLLWRKNGAALTALLAGSLGLLALGMVFNPAWLWQYLSNGGMLMKKYQGIQVTLWGVADQLLNGSAAGWLGALMVTALLAAAAWRLLRSSFGRQPEYAGALLLPAALLLAPYSWSYDQTVLLFPLLWSVLRIARKNSVWWAVTAFFGVLLLAAGLYFVAARLGHDVWSVWVTLAVLGLALGVG